MRLWSGQHPSVLETLQRGERYVYRWEWKFGAKGKLLVKITKK